MVDVFAILPSGQASEIMKLDDLEGSILFVVGVVLYKIMFTCYYYIVKARERLAERYMINDERGSESGA
jgi:hypothetical protein